VNFTKYAGNPVIPNTHEALSDFRDPKVFHNPVKGGWTMVVTAFDRAYFYHSTDLKSWVKTGEFGPDENWCEGIWECTDLFPLSVNGGEKWVLIVSMGRIGPGPFDRSHRNRGSRTQYFIGSFDGDTFICDTPFDSYEFIDQGYDNFAGVSFDNAERRLLVSWAANWMYADKTPTGEFCGCYSLAKELSLIDTPKGGLRLAQKPVCDGVFTEGAASDGKLPGELFKLTVKGEGAATVSLTNREGQTFRFGVNEENEVFVDRRDAGAKDFSDYFAADWYSVAKAARFYDGSWELELIFDRSIAELAADDYTRIFTMLLFPDSPYTDIAVEGSAELILCKKR